MSKRNYNVSVSICAISNVLENLFLFLEKNMSTDALGYTVSQKQTLNVHIFYKFLSVEKFEMFFK